MTKNKTIIPQDAGALPRQPRRARTPSPPPPRKPNPLLDEQNLKDEISMLRSTLRRFFELAKGCDDADSMASTLNVIGLAAIRISRLLLAERQLGGAHDPLLEAIQSIVAETARDMTTLVNDL